MKKIIKGLVLSIYYLLTKLFPVNKNIIVFESNIGRNYSGNPRAIYERMIELGLDRQYKCYWVLEDTRNFIPGKCIKIKNNRSKFFYIMAVSGIWVCDTRLPKYIIKRNKCTYIQTWHGTPLKKLGLDMDTVFMAGEKNIEDYKKNFIKNTKTWDYLISQNNYSTEIFKKAFYFNKEILEIGYPRNDILFHDNNEEAIVKIKKDLNLPLDKKIILYAPTWRDNEFHDIGKYKFNPNIDFDLLKKELDEDVVIIVKYHYLVMEQIDWSPYKNFIYSFDMSYDISSLYLVSDILITDYSSVMFDYSILKRPMIFYCYDLNQYMNDIRGFYFDFVSEAPGPIIKESKDLTKYIKDFNNDLYYKEYNERYNRFVNKYNHLDNGLASIKTIELINKIAKQ
ncbi:MAG TPA: CDP-glycerol glycerophosphotransferase family protein [Clostridiales bacterium]|nr:CDP-glycerol glycerophosphotransferase family protein [Clostridiales bacterium]